jgi:hypothetical protein
MITIYELDNYLKEYKRELKFILSARCYMTTECFNCCDRRKGSCVCELYDVDIGKWNQYRKDYADGKGRYDYWNEKEKKYMHGGCGRVGFIKYFIYRRLEENGEI